eukprot:350468-Chlamydomonas_euryale.AAC.4
MVEMIDSAIAAEMRPGDVAEGEGEGLNRERGLSTCCMRDKSIGWDAITDAMIHAEFGRVPMDEGDSDDHCEHPPHTHTPSPRVSAHPPSQPSAVAPPQQMISIRQRSNPRSAHC